jgi:hypothetical protein
VAANDPTCNFLQRPLVPAFALGHHRRVSAWEIPMSDTQGARNRFIWARPTKRLPDRNSSEAGKERDQGAANRDPDHRTKYRFGPKRRHPSRPQTSDLETPMVDQVPTVELREKRLAAWLEAMLEQEIERNR